MSLELQTTLAVIFQQLADFFGTTVDAIAVNAPGWLAKYGWYAVWDDIILGVIFGFILSLIAIVILAAVIYGFFKLDEDNYVPLIVTSIIVIIIWLFIAIGVPLIRCNASPEIYGAIKLLELIKS